MYNASLFNIWSIKRRYLHTAVGIYIVLIGGVKIKLLPSDNLTMFTDGVALVLVHSYVKHITWSATYSSFPKS